jgi:multidrug efflux pump subunit AcrA (membrane-fusion protein)
MPGRQASQPLRHIATVCCLAACLVVGLFGCAEADDQILVSGNVDDDLVTVQAPHIQIPELDLNAGFADPPVGTTASQPVEASRPARAAAPIASRNRVATVKVREGDQVQAGQVLVRLESAALDANLAVARADAKVAASQVPVLDSAIEETFDRQRDINSALRKINKAIRRLIITHTTLSVQLAQARRQLPQLEAKRVELQRQRQQLGSRLADVDERLVEMRTVLAQLSSQRSNTPVPRTSPTPPNREKLLATIAELQQARTQLTSGLNQLAQADAQLITATTRLRNGIPKLERSIRQIDEGLAKARTQRTKLRKARSKIIDARAELRRTRKLAVVAANAATVGIDIAENQKLLATVTAPASGVLVHAATVGEVVAAGTTIATIRQAAASSLTTWLSPAQVAQTCLGARALVYADWMNGQPMDAMITLIGDRADYPPTAFATDEVHLTRAIPVRLTLTRSSGQPQPWLPPGAPVDIEISPGINGDSCSSGTTSR